AAAAAAAAAAAKAVTHATADATVDTFAAFFDAFLDAARIDYQLFIEMLPGMADEGQRHATDTFFARPLWTSPLGSAWMERIEQWDRELRKLESVQPGISQIAQRHRQYLEGGRFNFDAARERVDEWLRTRHEGVEKEESSTHTEKAGTKKVAAKKKQKAKGAETVDAEEAETPDFVEESGSEEEKTEEPVEIIDHGAAAAISDVAATEDHLGRKRLVESLAAMFASPAQATPFTLGLLGDWGSGKSSVVEQVKLRLRNYEGKPGCPFRFYYADFNAWQYEHTDNIRAGLAQEVIKGLLGDLRRWWEKPILKLKFGWRENRGAILSRLLAFVGAIALSVLLIVVTWVFDLAGKEIINGTIAVGLTSLFGYLVVDAKRILDHPLAAELSTYLKLPDYGKHLGEVPVMKKHIETLCNLRGVRKKDPTHRLIVFVDDLDRCDRKCINHTLDAVRLVMDIPNVIVVIAIDHRIALQAVSREYTAVATGERDRFTIARDYLGKIIQLSVMLENPATLDEFIKKRLFPTVSDEDAQTAAREEQDRTREENADALNSLPRGGISAEPLDESPSKLTTDAETIPTAATDRPIAPTRDADPNRVAPQTPTITESDRLNAMKELASEWIAFTEAANTFQFRNPRQLIRLRNTYRLLTQLDLQQNEGRRRENPEMLAMLFWLEYLNERNANDRERLIGYIGLKPQDGKKADVKKTVTAVMQQESDSDAAAAKYILAKFQDNDEKLDSTRYEARRRDVERFVLPSAQP
ncbi:MAG TPA: P-loop NTPase fold protein, partial [Phycisphaerales bacterium]|nr:P-loop NTPase fold protein [Phycisphaerales bacterium]HRQ76262.1 P-loop NTPase fold protein [Phycisphaerales bacterium]